MFCHNAIRVGITLVICLTLMVNAFALISVGGAGPVPNRDWPAHSETLANLPTRFSFWEGPPYGGGNYHFEYAGSTTEFQTGIDAFSKIEAPRLELIINDGATTSTFSKRPVNWEFEIWSTNQFFKLNHPQNSITMSNSPWFNQPLPPPRLSVFLGGANPIDWKAIHVPANITVQDRRAESLPSSSSKGGMIKAVIYDMATSHTLPATILEVGRWNKNRLFEAVTSATAAADGSVLIGDIAPGDYVLQLRRQGYATREVGHYKNYGHTLAVLDHLVLAPAAEIKGVVTDPSGRPIEGVTVGVQGLVGIDGLGYTQNLYNEMTKAQSDSAGRFTLAGLPQGRINLRVKKPGFHYFSFDTHRIPGDDLTITMTSSGKIRGRVLGASALAPDQRAYIKLEPVGDPVGRWGGDYPCDAQGVFTIEGVPADSYTLVAFVAQPQKGGYTRVNSRDNSNAQQITLKQGEEREVNFELSQKP